MNDLMLTAVLSMPYDMAMGDEFSRRQFWDRAQQALAEIERLTAEVASYQQTLREEYGKREALDAEIERMTEENRRLRADLLAGRNVVNAGLTIHTLTIERDMLRQEIERLTDAMLKARRQHD